MRYRLVGHSGLSVSTLGLGCNKLGRGALDARASAAIVEAALDEGVTLFDTADVYGDGESERVLGAALAGRRNDVVISTKFGRARRGRQGARSASRREIFRAVEGSLRRLGTDYVDLYQLHAPDPSTPILETLSALDDLIHAGKVRYVGSSNMAAWQIADADWTARAHGLQRFVSVQAVYNVVDRDVEREVLPCCREFGVGVLAAVPLARGVLTGKYVDGPRDITPAAASYLRSSGGALARVREAADAAGCSPLELVLGAIVTQPQVASVVAGATSPEQARANARAVAWASQVEHQPAVSALAAVGD